ncbi:HET-domain-containing protein [Trametes sanguinea]|nr:HET-domain-containing protein [Trametes sanguinea]
MWLLSTVDYKLRSFPSVEGAPPYVALSHRWDAEGEVTFPDIHNLDRARSMSGWPKIENACKIAAKNDILWIWIDTCCIDKASSAELSEAINSMFALYLHSRICLAYLGDVPAGDKATSSRSFFRTSAWFTRGWTLQELLAPAAGMILFAQDWSVIGTRHDLASVIEEITGIDRHMLTDVSTRFFGADSSKQWTARLRANSLAKRMSWAARRVTTRPEDRAYSLMGIFGVHMSILYGEGGANAFRRLQLQIIRQSADQTIFAWGQHLDSSVVDGWMRSVGPKHLHSCPGPSPLLAPSPDAFANSGGLRPVSLRDFAEASCLPSMTASHYYQTHHGIHIRLPLRRLFAAGSSPFAADNLYCGALACSDHSGTLRGQRWLGLLLVQEPYDDASIYRCTDVMLLNTSDGRFPVVKGRVWSYTGWQSGWEVLSIYICID